MLDIKLFRTNPETIRESQRRRFAIVEAVDEIIELDKEWRQRQYEVDNLRKAENKLNKEVGKLKISGADATELIQQIEKIKQDRTEKEAEADEAKAARKAKLVTVGNLIRDSVPISSDEANNPTIKVCGEKRVASLGQEWKNHVDLCELLGIIDTKRGAKIAGARAFFLEGDGEYLKEALISYAKAFLVERGFARKQPPYLMKHEAWPSAHNWHSLMKNFTRYVGYSTCFRKEAGSHGRDTRGIFRVHQFDKVEQFCTTSPDDPWAMFDELMKNNEDFYQSLKLPYRVVSIVSGALNDAAAQKYDLEGWFPASETYRELVSCSNCTDYQARRLNIRYGQKKSNEETKQYVHTLNSTLTAAERTICCILENYQREDGVDIPEVLQPFMGGMTFLPFKANPVAKMRARKDQMQKI